MCSRPAAPNIHGAAGNRTSEICASRSMWLRHRLLAVGERCAQRAGLHLLEAQRNAQSADAGSDRLGGQVQRARAVEQLLLTLKTGSRSCEAVDRAVPEHDSP